MLGPVPALVAARLRHRAGSAVVSVAAVGAAAALVASVAGIGLISADATLARTLSATGAHRPVVRVSHFSHSSRDASASAATAADALTSIDPYAGTVQRGIIVRQLVDLEASIVDQIVAMDDPAPWTTVIEGRLPAACLDGVRCEAILLSGTALDPAVVAAHPSGNMELTIVGRGLIDAAVPFGELDQRGPVGERIGGGTYQTGEARPAVLLVVGVDALAASPALDETGRTYVWTAPVDPNAIHPWTASGFADAVDAATSTLTGKDPAFSVASPTGLIGAELRRADAARGRLSLIGAFGVAILLAFAVFLALVVREDVAAETARLTAAGARRRDRLVFLVLEALVPALTGGILGWLVGGVAVGALAAWSGIDVGPIVVGALLAPGSIVAALAVLLAIVGAIVAASAPGLPRRGALRLVGSVGATAALLLGWQVAVSGPLEPAGLGSSLANPVLVLLPPVIAFLFALAFLQAWPPLLRALARRLRRAPLPIRLSLLSVSREPGRPAATLTLLTFSLGAIVFAVGWSASLRQGIDDAAAYRSGLDLRVTELGTGLSIARSVVPIERYEALGDDLRRVPVYRDATTTQPGGRVEIVGIAPDALASLPGFRSDFSDVPLSELATRLTLPGPATGWRTAGHRLPAGAPDLIVRFRFEGDPLRLDAVVATDDGDTTSIPLGVIFDGMTTASAPLPEAARGGLLTALIFRHGRDAQGPGHEHELRRASVELEGLDGLTDDSRVDLEVFTVSTVIIRAPQVTDGMVLPAVVSPDLAAGLRTDRLDLHVGNDAIIPLRVVATATRVPTIIETTPRFILVALDPFLVALAKAVPGAGRPSEMWIAAPTAERLAEVRAALREHPFRFAEVTARPD
ncbi:MAG: ABC transporter permease, partial [Chloroflexi bacterium]|nr:ABC transporter permease [Chloroflexota bacterium]